MDESTKMLLEEAMRINKERVIKEIIDYLKDKNKNVEFFSHKDLIKNAEVFHLTINGNVYIDKEITQLLKRVKEDYK